MKGISKIRAGGWFQWAQIRDLLNRTGHHPVLRMDSLDKTLMLGKIEGRRRREGQKMRWLDGITNSIGHVCEQAPGVGDGQGGLACCSPWGRRVGPDWVTELNWTGHHEGKSGITEQKPWSILKVRGVDLSSNQEENRRKQLPRVIKYILPATSLVVYSLGIYLAMQGAWVRSLVGELRSHVPQSN